MSPSNPEPAHDISIEVIATDLVTGEVLQRLDIPLVRPRDNAPFNLEARYDDPYRVPTGFTDRPVTEAYMVPRRLSIHVAGIVPRPDGGALYTLTKYPPKDQRPHSRACGIKKHDHGSDCSRNCPTCGGYELRHTSTGRIR